MTPICTRTARSRTSAEYRLGLPMAPSFPTFGASGEPGAVHNTEQRGNEIRRAWG